MELSELIFTASLLFSLWLLYKANTKKYTPLRQQEAERYFNGSVVNATKSYRQRTFTHGISLAKDQKTKKHTFKKQAKMCDTALLYS